MYQLFLPIFILPPLHPLHHFLMVLVHYPLAGYEIRGAASPDFHLVSNTIRDVRLF